MALQTKALPHLKKVWKTCEYPCCRQARSGPRRGRELTRRPLLASSPPRPRRHPRADSYQKGQRTQQLSPFEIDVLGPLFRNMGANLRHKVEDNFWDVAPPLVFYSGLVYVVKQIRADILYHHRS